ncbi:hypothetical protein WR25_09573 [Diploscapter pachys]|uniref:Sulfhydryl oxidase n=1 Tax=Diploscapter pachys TaxID=2018661 RepID=A0A2A2KX80_9BILA|nr:hypothetical protein WR25_09573 [Diploscapter pachys]
MRRKWHAGLILLTLAAVTSLVTSDSLYGKDDPILELDVNTFDDNVYNKNKAFFVEFYSSWCGACIAYAPTFKKFAGHLSAWSPIVQVTVVNCAEDKNLPLCREHSIAAFPTLKYFKYQSKSKEDVLHYKGDKYDLDKMEADIAGLVQADADQQKPSEWPSFSPIDSSTTLQELWSASGDAELLVVAFEENPATIVWANLINFHKDRRVRVALGKPQHPLAVEHFGATANRRFIVFNKANTAPVFKSEEDVKWLSMQEKINELMSELGSVGKAPNLQAPDKVEPVITQPQVAADLSQFSVQLVDLQSAMSYMLYNEIPRREIISGNLLQYLKAWMHTLKKYAPGTTPVRRLFYRLDEWLQTKMDSVTANEWTEKVNEIQLELGNPLPREVHWVACQGSKPHLRGYTCGVWTMAHAISVEAYKLDHNNPSFRPAVDVLEPFRGFIVNFLSCSECAQNFDKEAQTHQLHTVNKPEDVILWLWKVHNFVNKRLSGSPSDDPKHPKQQFPPKAICTQCYDANGALVDDMVLLDFLKTYYSNIKMDGIKDGPGYKFTEYKDGKMQAAGQRHLDINPKFAIHAEQVNDGGERLNAHPQRQWRNLEDAPYRSVSKSEGSYRLFFLLPFIAIGVFVFYCKYRRNRSKFWKTFYYNNDFKL